MKIYKEMTKDNTALIVIDPVNSCAHKDCETPEWGIHFSKIRTMLPKLNNFIKEYRKKVGGLVVVTTITPWDKKHLAKNLIELYKDPKCTYYSEDTTGFDEQFYEVKVEKSDFVIAKNTYDVFTNQDLCKKLAKEKIKYIIITGIFTDGCVLASVIGGFSKGYNFVILKDLIETTDVKIRQALQKTLIKYTFPVMYGKTITSKELLKGFKN
ncbi:cysteine hydrolase [bacterium]|nr:cysteine hydrolase [bacterium]